MTKPCAKFKCENPRKDGEVYCDEHPPLVNHGLTPNETVCPDCGEKGMGTIHNDLWYCLDDYGFTGCHNLVDPYKLAGVEKTTKW